MGYEHNDIAIMGGLRAALEEETPMFERNDIVTTYKMNEAIAEGGGGGGDFSTATVTIINNSSKTVFFPCPGWISVEGDEFMVCTAYAERSSTEEYPALLYNGKGAAELAGFQDVTYSVSGNAIDDDGLVTITGDCTFTFTDK